MCGIAGIVTRPGTVAKAELAAHMAETLERRGPDASGHMSHDNVAMGHRRLSIIDTSEVANQPMFNESGAVATVFNGEIYNFESLRGELEELGHRFSTRSDTEVLVHGWEQWGTELVTHLRGMFAFAIYDQRTRQLFIARDRLGQKPLYYGRFGDKLLFASELKALRAGVDELGELDEVAVAQFATFGYTCGERTIHQRVRKLLPGHSMIVDTGSESLGCSVEVYWEPRMESDAQVPDGEWLDRLDETLNEAVRLRMISDVPLGAFLSGGIDSSLIVAYMVQHSPRVQTFAIGFDDSAFDESKHAQRVADHLGTEHHTEIVAPSAVAVLPDLIDAYDEPFGDSSAIPTYYLARMTRRHVTVALSGDGGDEFHAGYNRYTKGSQLQRVNWALGGLGRRALSRAAELLPEGRRERRLLERVPLRGFELYGNLHGLSNQHRALLRADLGGREVDAGHRRDYGRYAAASDVIAAQYADIRNYLPDDILVKVDRASMWHSLEVRCPLLDHQWVELSNRVPSHLKLSGLRGKLLLRELLYRRVPRELIERPKKGFGVPLESWFRGTLREPVREMLADRQSTMWQYFDHYLATRYAAAHENHGRDLSSALWRLLVFYRWSRRFTS